jgi:hypothetical protein
MRDRCFDPLTLFQTQKNIAILKSVEGDHRGALADLERLSPLARLIAPWYPHEYYDYLNSLAVDLGEVGRSQEALRASRIALESPYASAYPEWRETWQDIQARGCRASRSVVAFTQGALKTENVLRLPAPERGYSFGRADASHNALQQSARVLDYVEWKNKMVKEPNGTPQDDKSSNALDDREKMLKIIQLVSQPDRTDQELREILEAVEKIVSKPKGRGRQ